MVGSLRGSSKNDLKWIVWSKKYVNKNEQKNLKISPLYILFFFFLFRKIEKTFFYTAAEKIGVSG